MKKHFLAYIERIKNPAESELGARFEKRFDRDAEVHHRVAARLPGFRRKTLFDFIQMGILP